MLRHTNIIGSVSESLVVAYLASQGHEVFGPLTSNGRADLVYVKGGVTIKVQVKTATLSTCSSSPHEYEQFGVTGQNKSSPYTADEVDEFWVVGTHLWCFPFEAVDGLKMVTLSSTNTKPRKTVRAYDPNDFIVVFGSLDRKFRDRVTFNDPDPSLLVSKTEYCDIIAKRVAGKERNAERAKPFGPKTVKSSSL